MTQLVIKLGGSHAGSSLLHPWIDAIAAVEGIVLVPGGGPFADTVRALQPAIGYNDHAAHDMALMAMAQFGRALAALSPRFTWCDDLRQIPTATEIPVWSPWPGLRNHPDIPQSWDVTSDSLALWLAGALEIPSVLLVKHRAAPDLPIPLLAQEAIVDPAFPAFAARYTGAIYIAGPGDTPRGAFDPHHPPGRRIAR